ncbi:MAG TPA: hypothetical protein VL793_10710 [Patescibacteria group bacterium]|nr:hypothetical protein [Patescibacteria group bacterium]
MKDGARPKYLILTCDSEALPKEAPDHHVDRLIWGRFPDAPYEAGIGKMMDVADELGMKMVFFHDVLEHFMYGAETDRAARSILERGHDLQMHMHIEFLPPDFWPSQGYQRVTWAMNLFNDQAARVVVQCGIELFERMAGRKPIAYRAGAFRYNMSILRALGEFQIPLSFQYYPATALKSSFPHGFDAGILPVFRWNNGVVEIPLGAIERPHPRKGLSRYLPFELNDLRDAQHARDLMEEFWNNGPEFNVYVMLLHSWSFLDKNATNHFAWQSDARVRLFREILAGLPSDVEVITATQLLQKMSAGEIVPAFDMPVQVAGTEQLPLLPIDVPASAYHEMVCRIHDLVPQHVPPDANLIVLSKGDSTLSNIGGRRTWPFPRDPAGGYAGFYPESGEEAVRHLEALHAEGGQYFLLPNFAYWWLEHYPELRRYLETECLLLADVPDSCRLYKLGVRAQAAA